MPTPADHQPPASLPPLSDHACFLIYPLANCRYPPQPGQTLGQLADSQRQLATQGGSPWLFGTALSDITQKRRNQPIWQPDELATGKDLHPHIRRLIGGKPQPGIPASEQHASVYRRSDVTHKLLNGERLAYPPHTPAKQKLASPLMLKLSDSAQRRIARQLPDFTQSQLPVHINDLHQIVFRTGHGLLVAEIRFAEPGQPLHPSLLLEGLSGLCQFNTLERHQGEADSAHSHPDTAVSLGGIIRSLSNEPSQSHPAERVFSATYLQFEQSPPAAELDQLLTRAARHYTDAYRLPSQSPHSTSVAHFDNIQHRFALEGCATAVDLSGYPSDQQPEFLKHYLNGTYRSHYLPVVLLAFHEFCFLLQLTNDASFWPQPDNEPDAITRMRAIREPITAFMLCFRFSFVSRIGMHNDINLALRKVLGLDAMLDELHKDSARIDSFLNEVSARKQEARAIRRDQRFRLLAVPGITAITWLSLFAGLKDVFAIPQIAHFLHTTPEQAAPIALLISLPLGIIAGAYMYMRERPSK